MIECQSAKAVAASSKDMPCFLRFSAAFLGSHSNFTPAVYGKPRLARCAIRGWTHPTTLDRSKVRTPAKWAWRLPSPPSFPYSKRCDATSRDAQADGQSSFTRAERSQQGELGTFGCEAYGSASTPPLSVRLESASTLRVLGSFRHEDRASRVAPGTFKVLPMCPVCFVTHVPGCSG